MLCTGSGQLGGVQSLADVVGGGSEENRLRVDAQIEIACGNPFEELPCNVVDCSQMGDQTRRSVNAVKQFGCFDWQWTQRGPTGVLEGNRQYSRDRHRDRVVVAVAVGTRHSGSVPVGWPWPASASRAPFLQKCSVTPSAGRPHWNAELTSPLGHGGTAHTLLPGEVRQSAAAVDVLLERASPGRFRHVAAAGRSCAWGCRTRGQPEDIDGRDADISCDCPGGLAVVEVAEPEFVLCEQLAGVSERLSGGAFLRFGQRRRRGRMLVEDDADRPDAGAQCIGGQSRRVTMPLNKCVQAINIDAGRVGAREVDAVEQGDRRLPGNRFSTTPMPLLKVTLLTCRSSDHVKFDTGLTLGHGF